MNEYRALVIAASAIERDLQTIETHIRVSYKLGLHNPVTCAQLCDAYVEGHQAYTLLVERIGRGK
jgi:hypothetical protein